MPRLKDWNSVTFEKADNYSVLTDEASATVTYVGKAKVGTETSETKWQIQRITTSGTAPHLKIEWPDGSDEFASSWDNRALLQYST